MEFDLENIAHIDMGVALTPDDPDAQETLNMVSPHAGIQDCLAAMVATTWQKIQPEDGELVEFDPGEDLRNSGPLYMPRDDDLAQRANWIADGVAANNVAALDNPADIAFYFARLEDASGRQVTGVRTARFLKGVTNKTLFRRAGDHARLVDGNVLALDKDFDFLIDEQHIYILRPGAFEVIGGLRDAILAAAEGNVETIGASVGFLAMDRIRDYSVGHPTAARLLASIARRPDLEETRRDRLEAYCQQTNVALAENDGGTLEPADGYVLGFLKVMDRRRYPVRLTDDSEVFEAAARRAVNA